MNGKLRSGGRSTAGGTGRSGRRRSDAADTGAHKFTVFAAFVVLVFACGGGARDDLTSLLILRPIAAGFAAWALLVAQPGELRAIRFPLLFLGAIALLGAVQLIPLPPAFWHGLPGRGPIAARDALAGVPDLWRPMSLSPSKTANMLASLIVPATMLLTMAVVPPALRGQIVPLVILIALASAVLGLMQVLGPPGGLLYLYRVTNPDSAVGLFANRNHQAFFLATAYPLAMWYVLFGPAAGSERAQLWLIAIAAGAVLWAAVVVSTGSRAGLVLFAVGLSISYAMYLLARSRASRSGERRRSAAARSPRGWTRVTSALGIATAIVALVWIVPQLPAWQRFASGDYASDSRFAAAPTLFRITLAHFPVGTGFGSLEHIYKVYEPDALLRGSYLNQAHDDWLQVVLEAGLPGALLILVAAFAFLRRCRVIVPRLRSGDPQTWLAAVSLVALAMFAAVSVTDYPLRVPSLIGFVSILSVFALVPARSATRSTHVESVAAMR